ncbi:hypothetical protein [Pelotomaculum propionicicum]|uniref:Uncharacterized protein n=1 Tax=Pelotomaculum propionicicum TaxID=258475 RepID=A0A4Y7RIE5_9FIRM|nr:hypothetical protein [Pelotomaculum propionicicum]NLI13187.1 hypothetical protein [Peptococcaceae bacterium]TEB08778.1 hypothetical protein Pmgp_03626 [Pelotomaculum propionicicum]
MNWTKYKIVLLISVVVVAVGASTAVSRFNHRVCPQEPARILALANYGPGAYQVTFLGENIYLHLPVYTAPAFFDYEYLDSGREYLVRKFVIVRDYGENFLDSHSEEINALERNAFKVKNLLEELFYPADAC